MLGWVYATYKCFVFLVTGTTDCGLLEGVLHGQGTGLLPPHCVQEVRLQQGVVPPPVLPQPPPQQPPSIMMGSLTTSRVQGRRESMHKHFATAPRLKKQWVLHNSSTSTRATAYSFHVGFLKVCCLVSIFPLLESHKELVVGQGVYRWKMKVCISFLLTWILNNVLTAAGNCILKWDSSCSIIRLIISYTIAVQSLNFCFFWVWKNIQMCQYKNWSVMSDTGTMKIILTCWIQVPKKLFWPV